MALVLFAWLIVGGGAINYVIQASSHKPLHLAPVNPLSLPFSSSGFNRSPRMKYIGAQR